MTQQQTQQNEYTNEIIAALEEQRNVALKEAAQLKAALNLTTKNLKAMLEVIKTNGLEKYFFDDQQQSNEEADAKKQKPQKIKSKDQEVH